MRAFAKLVCMLTVLVSGEAFAADTIAVRLVGDSVGFTGMLTTRIEARIRQSPNEFQFGEEDRTSTPIKHIVVAVGSKGWSALESLAPDVQVIAVLPPRNLLENALPTISRPLYALYGDMAPSRTLNFVSLFLQQRRSTSVSILAGPQTQARLGRLESLAAEKGMHLISERVEREIDIGAAVERLTQHGGGVLLALPDPIAHTSSTVSPILMTTYRAGIPVVAYSESYLKAGATAALYATPDQVTQQVMEMLSSLRQGKPVAPIQYLKYFTVGTNQTVARSLGMNLPPADVLESRLRSMKE